jgi:hypothetical protein
MAAEWADVPAYARRSHRCWPGAETALVDELAAHAELRGRREALFERGSSSAQRVRIVS